MSRRRFFLVFLLSIFTVYAKGMAEEKSLVFKVILDSARGYYILSDGSCYKVYSFIQRWRTPYEWWNDFKICPINYLRYTSEIPLGETIQVQPKPNYVSTHENESWNHEDLANTDIFLFVPRTDKCLFGLEITPSAFLVDLAKKTHAFAYEEGFLRARLWIGPKDIDYLEGNLFPEEELYLEDTKKLKAKVVVRYGDGYYVLSDNTFWKVDSYKPKRKSAYDWWVTLWTGEGNIPYEYQAIPEHWNVGANIKVLLKQDIQDVDILEAANHERLLGATHLFLNQDTNEIIFAKRVTMIDCIINVYHDAFDIGFTNGNSRNGYHHLEDEQADVLK